jgi:hypothetical protein
VILARLAPPLTFNSRREFVFGRRGSYNLATERGLVLIGFRVEELKKAATEQE